MLTRKVEKYESESKAKKQTHEAGQGKPLPQQVTQQTTQPMKQPKMQSVVEPTAQSTTQQVTHPTTQPHPQAFLKSSAFGQPPQTKPVQVSQPQTTLQPQLSQMTAQQPTYQFGTRQTDLFGARSSTTQPSVPTTTVQNTSQVLQPVDAGGALNKLTPNKKPSISASVATTTATLPDKAANNDTLVNEIQTESPQTQSQVPSSASQATGKSEQLSLSLSQIPIITAQQPSTTTPVTKPVVKNFQLHLLLLLVQSLP